MTPFVCSASRHLTFRTPSLAVRVLRAVLFVLLPIVPFAGAQATPSTVAEVATYDGADRQAMLEAGARQEGTLLLYTTGTQIQPLIDRFSQKYPYIRVGLLRADTEQVTRRFIEEYAAGLYQADGFELEATGLILAGQQGLLQPFFSSEAASYDPLSIEPQKRWISVRESYGGIGYNTDIIPADQAPKTWGDLADPRFKGKLGISGSSSIVARWTSIIVEEYGRDMLQKIAAQDMRVYDISSRALANLTVSGEVPISARASNAHFIASRKDGAHVAWVAPGLVEVNDDAAAIATRAPHPHAMMLMIDFLLSREGQGLYGRLGYDSARLDMERPDSPKQKVYFEQHPNFFEEYEESTRLFNATFAHNH